MLQTKCLVVGSCTGQKDDEGCPEELKIEVFGDLWAGDPVVKIASDAIHSGDAVRVQNQASAAK